MIATLEERIRALFVSGSDVGSEPATSLYAVRTAERDDDLAAASPDVRAWADAIDFRGAAGSFALAPSTNSESGVSIAGGVFGVGDKKIDDRIGALPFAAPARLYALVGPGIEANRAALSWALGAYRFDRYSSGGRAPARLMAADADLERVAAIATGVWYARDLVNTPAADMGPADLEAAARALAERHGAACEAIVGEPLLEQNYPMIHAVGRAGSQPPRLIDLRWSASAAGELPRVTLVGKGVCFDTGGLDIKPARFMRNMKKDMGGAAAVLGLAHMIMARELPVQLRVLIPAVENNVAANAFRPGDILTSRDGLTVEIGDTDAEGRLVLADALTEANGDDPELLLDFATLTGAARVAVGPEIAPFYTGSDALAAEIADGAARARDPVWRMPLWDAYETDLSSKVADISNVSNSGYAGSITAALFLRRFVARPERWAHFDVFAWNPKTAPGRPEGGELSAGRAIFEALERRYALGPGA